MSRPTRFKHLAAFVFWASTHAFCQAEPATLPDVRIAAPIALMNTTSKSDPDDRWLAATSVYTNLRTAADTFSTATFEQVVNPSDGKTYMAFDVVYADGVSEKWMILPSSASLVKPFEPQKVGTGTLAPAPLASGSSRQTRFVDQRLAVSAMQATRSLYAGATTPFMLRAA